MQTLFIVSMEKGLNHAIVGRRNFIHNSLFGSQEEICHVPGTVQKLYFPNKL